MNLTGQAQTGAASLPMPGLTWALLNAERQEVCAALLSIPPWTEERKIDLTVREDVQQQAWQRLEALQLRLSRIDGAMDQLMAGSYGLCRECGGAIERKRLADDPAALVCYSCQKSIETEHALQSM
jgi:RNA polymerase-binding transcription factor DksA